MSRLVPLVLVAVAVAAGCKKGAKETQPDSAPPRPVSGTGSPIINQQGDLSVSGSGSGVGFGGPRKAAARIANKVQLDQLYKSMFASWQLDGAVPGKDEVLKEARQNPQLWPLIQEEVVILTGSTSAEGIWAYTQYPQQAGKHFAITRSGVEDMTPEDLKRRLELQKSEVKLSK